jgi:hypothetical protein
MVVAHVRGPEVRRDEDRASYTASWLRDEEGAGVASIWLGWGLTAQSK